LVTGAVTGGGLTIIANAPNPAGASILKSKFADGEITPLGLLAGAAIPTLVAIACFRAFPF
jgi:di/tricarboxylate transporter